MVARLECLAANVNIDVFLESGFVFCAVVRLMKCDSRQTMTASILVTHVGDSPAHNIKDIRLIVNNSRHVYADIAWHDDDLGYLVSIVS